MLLFKSPEGRAWIHRFTVGYHGNEFKERAATFTSTEQRLLLETYEEFKDVITKKGNTAAINKAREKGWQEIADRLNA